MKSMLSSRHLSNLVKVCCIAPLTLGVFGLAPMQAAFADEPRARTVTVTGQGVEVIDTTLTQVQLGVEAQGDTAQDVQQEVARRSAAVVELLRSRNVSRLQTTGINLNPVYSYTDNQQRVSGYSAANIVSFQLATAQVGTLLDDAVRAGASRIDSVSFIASDEAIAAARQEALREATQDAQQQADAVLGTLGLTRREVVSIQIGEGPIFSPPMPYAAADRAASATPVIGGEQQVQANVTLEISY
ncbi:MAG: SIMPL domain-containing protein [Oculatellaceae cyanobacterium bins.114]|nr:SIMPL domain-containing protein [Oculatellaceae cyanobacterium bins.114]